MKRTTRFLAFFLVLTMLVSLVSCGSSDDPTPPSDQGEGTPVTVVDARGRTVTVEKTPERVVCIGASALRLYSYVGDMTKLVGVEQFEKGDKMPVRPYSYAYRDLFLTLPVIGTGGPNSAADAEAIVTQNPDVIFSLYDNVEAMNELQRATGIPVVCLSYGGSDPFSEQVTKSLFLIGTVMRDTTRFDAVTALIDEVKTDLENRTMGVPESKKKTAYFGCNTYNGGRGTFGDTLTNYSLFRVLDVHTITSDLTVPVPTLDAETLLVRNPEVVFIDIANVGTLLADMEERPEFYGALSAFAEGKVYVQLPFNQYYTNLDIALADAYFIGKTLYPDRFADVDLTAKLNEICSGMLGVEMDYSAKITAQYGRSFGVLDVSEYLQ